MRLLIRYGCLCVLLLLAGMVHSQMLADNTLIFSTDKPARLNDSVTLFTIKGIDITGNRRTKPSTILREVSFQVNDQLPLNVIVNRFYETRKQIMNTGLFRTVVVSLKSLRGYEVYVNIDVEEKWYIYPLPFVHLVNDNFHKWWTDDGRRLDYLKYGIKVTQNNMTGRNDKLDIYFMNGYTQEVALNYHGLYLDKDMKWYSNVGLSYGKDRELFYETDNNKQVSLKDADNFIHSFADGYASITYRPAIKTRHTLRIEYTQEKFSDTILKLNPFYSYAPHSNNIRYPSISYTFSYYDVDFIPYPTSGYMGEASVIKKGFNDPINLWQLTAKAAATWPAFQKYMFDVKLLGLMKLPLRQPYMTQQFLGANDMFLQGYEYYVVDGTAGGYAKLGLRRQILNTFIHVPGIRINKINSLPSTIPIKIYAKAYLDAGYIYNPVPGNNSLQNKMLYSSGIGLDIVSFTDFVIKLEWSFNQLGQNNLYLHRLENF